MSERSWGSPRELCEQGARVIKALVPPPPYRWLLLEVAA